MDQSHVRSDSSCARACFLPCRLFLQAFRRWHRGTLFGPKPRPLAPTGTRERESHPTATEQRTECVLVAIIRRFVLLGFRPCLWCPLVCALPTASSTFFPLSAVGLVFVSILFRLILFFARSGLYVSAGFDVLFDHLLQFRGRSSLGCATVGAFHPERPAVCHTFFPSLL